MPPPDEEDDSSIPFHIGKRLVQLRIDDTLAENAEYEASQAPAATHKDMVQKYLLYHAKKNVSVLTRAKEWAIDYYILRRFRGIEVDVLLDVARHVISPMEVWKVRHWDLLEHGGAWDLSKFARFPSVEYLISPLKTYFQVLKAIFKRGHASREETVQLEKDVRLYMRSLRVFALNHEWRSGKVLEYHFAFHTKRLAEMKEAGNYRGWGRVDSQLAMQHFQVPYTIP